MITVILEDGTVNRHRGGARHDWVGDSRIIYDVDDNEMAR